MRTWAISCAVAAALFPAEAGAENWIGRYQPISAACQGLELVVAAGTMSFGDCAHAAFREMPATQGHAVLIDAGARACPIAGNVLTLAPDGPDANVLTLYDDEKAFSEARPKLVCAYSP